MEPSPSNAAIEPRGHALPYSTLFDVRHRIFFRVEHRVDDVPIEHRQNPLRQLTTLGSHVRRERFSNRLFRGVTQTKHELEAGFVFISLVLPRHTDFLRARKPHLQLHEFLPHRAIESFFEPRLDSTAKERTTNIHFRLSI